MKRPLLILLLALSVTTLAQSSLDSTSSYPKTRSLFGPKHQAGFTLGSFAQVGQQGRQAGLYMHYYAGLVINNSWTFAGYYSILGSEHSLNTNPQFGSARVNLTQAGLMTLYTPNAHRLVHMRYGLLLGVGEIRYLGNQDAYVGGHGELIMANPFVGLELNVFPFMRIDANVGYQAMSNFAGGIETNADYMSPVFQLGLRIGHFTR